MTELRGFQRRFLRGALAPDVDTACLSIPRGNGKSWLAGHLVSRILDPDDALFVEGTESVLLAASLEQARIVHRFARAELEPRGGYRFQDSATRASITHRSGTRLRVISSKAKTAMGLVGTPYAIADEPGAWEVVGGQMMWDALSTAQGKPDSPLKVLLIGTLAPATGGWWHELIADGSHGSTYVQALQGDPERWDQWPEIRRCNPLTAVSAPFRRKLLEERDKARRDSRLKARFMSYRLNRPTADESEVLLTVDDWGRVLARPLPEREGSPIVAVDLGGGRAWSAAVALWESGRVEALALAPGIPSLETQEARDRVPRGTYGRLAETGALSLAHGLRVPPPAQLCEMVSAEWGRPAALWCDRFRLNDLRDAAPAHWPIFPRVTRWSEAAADIRALRKFALDGPLAVEPRSRDLLTVSLAASQVASDDQGNVRLVKRDPANNTARDDVSAALVLAAGALDRYLSQPRPDPENYVVVGRAS